MTDTGLPARFTHLVYLSPLGGERAENLVARLTRGAHAEPYRTVLDLGCGWGTLMLDVLDGLPAASGIGVDQNAKDIARARASADTRGLAVRAVFHEESATDTKRGPEDVVLCVGASHALSDAEPPAHTATALAELRRHVNPGGRVLFAESFWERVPTGDELSRMWPDTKAEEFGVLADLVEKAEEAGFLVQWCEAASQDEWDAFESGYLADDAEWLAVNAGHSEAERIRREVAEQHAVYLRGYRGLLGFAYLTLIPAG